MATIENTLFPLSLIFWCTMTEELPLLPGYTFSDPTRTSFPKQQTLSWKRGVPIPTIKDKVLKECSLQELCSLERSLQFGDREKKEEISRNFVPEWAVLDKKVLRFTGYFTEGLSPSEIYSVRKVHVFYYLLDDTIVVSEPKTKNSGIRQGRLLLRQKVPHPDGGHWHWTHLNRDMVLNLYGRKIHICDCDEFTKEYLLSEGTELKPPVSVPEDPYTSYRTARQETPSRASDLRPRLPKPVPEYLKGIVLKFNAILETEDSGIVTAVPVVVRFMPEDSTVEIRKSANYEEKEITRFSPVVLKRTRIPLYPRCAGPSEIGEQDRENVCLSVQDFVPPTTINVFGKKVTISSCDIQTVKFLQEFLGVDLVPVSAITDLSKPVESGSSGRTQSDIVSRPIINSGTRPSKDPSILRFLAKMELENGEKSDRTFIISLYTVDSTIEIYEKASPGGFGGRILARTTALKPVPKEKQHRQEFYSLDDFFIGATLDIFGRRYEVTCADRAVYNYAMVNPTIVTPQLYSSVQELFQNNKDNNETANET